MPLRSELKNLLIGISAAANGDGRSAPVSGIQLTSAGIKSAAGGTLQIRTGSVGTNSTGSDAQSLASGMSARFKEKTGTKLMKRWGTATVAGSSMSAPGSTGIGTSAPIMKLNAVPMRATPRTGQTPGG